LAEKIAEGPQEEWGTDTLAAEAGVSPRSLSRLFRKQLNASPSKFVERVRIDQARRASRETEAQIENVAIQCGFGSLRRMDRAFTRAISATPTEFRARFKPPGPTA
jgi:transcriptional regulator GlxA family with amidase domain